MSKWMVVFVVLLALLACKKQQPAIVQPSAAEAAVLQEIGAQASAMLMDSLKKELRAAMQSGGPVQAIEVCSQKAMALTQQIKMVEDKAVQVKRTTLNYRNPANMPDPYEMKALEYFAANTDSNSVMPAGYMQKIHENDADFYYYYQPLKIGALCLKCHGPQEQLAAGVKQILQERYPADKATGYAEGDLRGLIRVRVDAL